MTVALRSTRRSFVLLLGTVAAPVACTRREPDTPLAHLHGREWVRGAFTHYATSYARVESRASERSFDAYRTLAQRGVTALGELQQRQVPFFVRVSADGERFAIERDVPERLTFTADMSERERAEATRIWKLAREHIHHDYEQIQRLELALTGLLDELGRVRVAIDEGRLEQFRIVRQLSALRAGQAPPFRLPYQVTRQDYDSVLLLLLERLETDRERLARLEASMVAVGLVVRATDAGSASLSANTEKVLLAVARDAQAAGAGRDAGYPESSDARQPLLERGRLLLSGIEAGADYRAWLAAEQEREDELGKFLTLLDQMTGLGVSRVYRQVMRIWRGQGDYFEYLRLASALVPGGGNLSGVLDGAVDQTARYRELVGSADRARSLLETARSGEGRAELEGAVVNVATPEAQNKLARQLVFYRDAAELEQVRQELAASALAR